MLVVLEEGLVSGYECGFIGGALGLQLVQFLLQLFPLNKHLMKVFINFLVDRLALNLPFSCDSLDFIPYKGNFHLQL